VSSLDLQIYVGNKLSNLGLNLIERNLAVNVITAICGYDPLYAEILSRNWSTSCDNFKTLLFEEAQRRNWVNKPLQNISNEIDQVTPLSINDLHKSPPKIIAEQWAEGMIDFVDGRLFLYPVAAGISKEDQEIIQRTWRGQVQTLLPLIDEYRVKIIRYLNENYRLDFKNVHQGCQTYTVDRNVSMCQLCRPDTHAL